MAYTKQVISLVTVLAMAVVMISSASAFADITGVEVNGVDALSGTPDVATFAGQVIPVRINFEGTDNVSDARVKVWLAGESGYASSSGRFDVLPGKTYSTVVLVQMPSRIDPQEDLTLEVSIESKSQGEADHESVALSVQRDSYSLEVLDVNAENTATAGEALSLDIVLKNSGSHLAEDTFVRVSIPSLGVEQRAFFGDLSAVDQSDPDLSHSAERRMLVNIPRSATSGTYVVEVEAYNADASSKVTRKIAVVGAGDESMVVSSMSAKTFNVGETSKYSLTLVNSGKQVRIYQLVPETSGNLNVDVEESVVVLSPGTSKTVNMDVSATEAGKYSFAVSVFSNNELVQKENFAANVEGRQVFAGNTTVLLTVVLAIIFVVLLVVLIVLLTRKPTRSEEFGESYY